MGSCHQAGHPQNVPTTDMRQTKVIIVFDDGDSNESNKNDAIKEEVAIFKKVGETNNGQSVHNLVVKTLHARAIQIDTGLAVEAHLDDVHVSNRVTSFNQAPSVAHGVSRSFRAHHINATLGLDFDGLQ